MRGETPVKIMCPYLLVCEGKDLVMFLSYYLNSEALVDNPRFSTDIQAIDYGGNQQLSSFLRRLRNLEGYDHVKRMLIIRDAETDPDAAIREIKKALRDNAVIVPEECNEWALDEKIGVAFTLLPTCSKQVTSGTLEDLCWEILKENSGTVKDEAEAFSRKMKREYGTIKAYEHKSRLHTWFSAHDEFVTMKLGEAARAGAFDWTNEKLRPLRKIIEHGFDDEEIEEKT